MVQPLGALPWPAGMLLLPEGADDDLAVTHLHNATAALRASRNPPVM